MMRADLLALTTDDLIALTNRGTVKRAERELAEKEVTGTIEETSSEVHMTWSDGPVCRFPAGVAVQQAQCDCAAVGLCRHLVRSVLAYRASQTTTQEVALSGPWNPGAIPDEELAKHFKTSVVTKIKAIWNAGVVVDLERSAKPMARFHQPQACLRFLVPGDIRTTKCDCAEESPCSHVLLAIWAFRELPVEQATGLVVSSLVVDAIPEEVFQEAEAVVAALLDYGISGATQAWKDQASRCMGRLLKAGLIWPAEILEELLEEYDRYVARDAAFTPALMVELLGELLIRLDAIRQNTGAYPQLLIRGTASVAAGTLGKTRLIGLGCRVVESAKASEIFAYLQDANTGAMLVLSRVSAKPEVSTNIPPKDFAAMGRSTAAKNFRYIDVARGQLVIDGGQRTTTMRLKLGRANVSLQAQTFQWENLAPATLIEDFALLQQRLTTMPPSCLRPRRVAEDFFVLRVAMVQTSGFDWPTQTVFAALQDATGVRATLRHKFTQAGQSGTEALLQALSNPVQKLVFVAGNVRILQDGLAIEPMACIFETPAGRTMLLPFCEEPSAKPQLPESVLTSRPLDAFTQTMLDLHTALEDLALVGLTRSGESVAQAWGLLKRTLEVVGLVQFAGLVGAVEKHLRDKQHQLRWESREVTEVLKRLLVLVRLSRDVNDGA